VTTTRRRLTSSRATGMKDGGANRRASAARPNYRIKLSDLGHRVVWGTGSRQSTGSLARARLGLQLMRGR
jgi:hypothetical protein